MNVIDRRRNLGPADAQPLVFAASTKKQTQSKDSKTTKEDPTSKKVFIETGNIKTSNGSAYLEHDKTIIMCSIYGPRPNFTRSFNDQATMKIGVSFANFIPVENLSIKSTNSINNILNNGEAGATTSAESQSLEVSCVT
ncbi:unnamed protein product [Ambrosiozyma monospora]|uniref:Unnamed protein product n=1 Tax=Ambrosiozyma monospora TaxID=43982 RepID=A0ACB5TAM7_AMBMO|nr:unnamed protein product [Ambrosiozyma monospora]